MTGRAVVAGVALACVCVGRAHGQTATSVPTSTPTPTVTQTPAPTPFSHHKTVAGLTIPFTYWSVQATAGTALDPHAPPLRYCLCGLELYSSDGSEADLVDGNGVTVFATKGTLALMLDRYGPCLHGPVAFSGTGLASICWYTTTTE